MRGRRPADKPNGWEPTTSLFAKWNGMWKKVKNGLATNIELQFFKGWERSLIERNYQFTGKKRPLFQVAS
jgi:hypothetical protein